MKTHILAGDALFGTFQSSGIEGTIIINRECLIDGPVASKRLDEFWKREQITSEPHMERKKAAITHGWRGNMKNCLISQPRTIYICGLNTICSAK